MKRFLASNADHDSAWTIIGLAIRCAHSLGLHVRNEDPSATASTRETLVRTWWSLYSLERTLSIITGRPSIVTDSCCSAPLPLPIAEERISEDVGATFKLRTRSTTTFAPTQLPFTYSSNVALDSSQIPNGFGTLEANSGSYFQVAVQLSIITHSIMKSLYSAGTMIRSQAELQQDISQLGTHLDLWVNTLPTEFDFQQRPNDSSEPFVRERILLAFQLCSAKMLLTRPCLTGRKSSWREANEVNFTSRMANVCLEAAITIVKLLPDEPRADLILEQGPWWCIIHHIMQAISVLLLALSYSTVTSHDPSSLIQTTKKAVSWLRNLRDPLADRAFHVALSLLDGVAGRYGVDVFDLWNMGIENVIGTQSHVQLPVSDTFMSACLSEHVMSMATPTVTHATVASYADWDAEVTDAAFPPQYAATSFDSSYYMARS